MGAVSGAWGQTARPGEQVRLWEAHRVAQAPREAASHGGEHSACERQQDAGWKARRSDTRAVCSVLLTSFSPEPRARLEQDRQANTGRTNVLTFAKKAVGSVRVCTSACVPACTRVRVLLRKVFSRPGFFKTRFGTFPDSSVG